MHRLINTFRLLLCLVIAFFVCALSSSKTFALDTQSMRFLRSVTGVNVSTDHCSTFDYRVINLTQSPVSYNSICMRLGSDAYTTGNYVTIHLIAENISNNDALDLRFRGLTASTSGGNSSDSFADVDVYSSNIGNSTTVISLTYKVIGLANTSANYGVIDLVNAQTGSAFNLNPNESLFVDFVSVWLPVDSSSNGATSADINQLHNDLSYLHQQISVIDTTRLAPMNSHLNVIENNTTSILNVLNQNLSATQQSIDDNTSAIEDGNQAAQDRWESDNQSISDNVSDGVSSFSGLNLALNLFNPFTVIQPAFSPNTCYDIPTLSSMLHAPTSNYCSWFSPTTRAVMSPAVTVFVGFMLCNFVWSYIKKGGV